MLTHFTQTVMDALGIFLTIAGFVIGLGAVTVIDLHGFLGRHSPYWTEATIRTHKVTKPLIWTGMALAIIGSIIVYREIGFLGYVPLQTLIAVALVLNGCFLSFWVSPRLLKRERQGKARELLPQSWQYAITVSFVVSFVGWWSEIGLFAWYLASL